MGIVIIPMFVLFSVVHGAILAFSLSSMFKLRKKGSDFPLLALFGMIFGIPLAVLGIWLDSRGGKIYAFTPAFVVLAYMPTFTLPIGLLINKLQDKYQKSSLWRLIGNSIILSPVITFPVVFFGQKWIMELVNLKVSN